MSAFVGLLIRQFTRFSCWSLDTVVYPFEPFDMVVLLDTAARTSPNATPERGGMALFGSIESLGGVGVGR